MFQIIYNCITGHWLNKNDLTRISCLLAIKRLKGRHTYDILAKSMELVYSEFEFYSQIIN